MDFSEGGILTAGAEEVAEGFEGDASVATFVEEGEGFFVVCRGLVGMLARDVLMLLGGGRELGKQDLRPGLARAEH